MERAWLAGTARLLVLALVLAPAPGRAYGDLPILPPGARTASQRVDPEGLQVDYTIDAALDAQVRALLDKAGIALGHVILMDPASGAVLAYVSTDPDRFPATRAYPMASLMKVVTAAAVLRGSPKASERDCRYVGSQYHVGAAQLVAPSRGGRVDSFWRALAISNNQCFARWAVHDVGLEALLAEMRSVGLLDSPAPGHPAGRVEPVEDDVALGHLGSGLAGSFITPLAAARLAATLADGQRVQPWWIERATDQSGRAIPVLAPEPAHRAWSTALADELRELLVGVTARGTAKSAFRDARGRPLLGPIRTAGKTGLLSGTNPPGRYHWFIGVAPAEAPRVAVAAVVVNPPWAGAAASVAAASLKLYLCGDSSCSAD